MYINICILYMYMDEAVALTNDIIYSATQPSRVSVAGMAHLLINLYARARVRVCVCAQKFPFNGGNKMHEVLLYKHFLKI